MLVKKLEKIGYQVTAFEDGHDAIDAIKKGESFDTILLDIQMPKISGLDVLKEIRKIKTINQLPIIMVSALDQKESIIKALEQGANDYITKPVDFPIAIARLKTTLAVRLTDVILEQQMARSSAQARLTSLGEMASGMAHEINNPLAIIVGTAQMLGKMVPSMVDEKSAEKVVKMCDRINVAAQRVSTVIKYVREFSQPMNEDAADLLTTQSLYECLEQLQDITSVKSRNLKVKSKFDIEDAKTVKIKANKAKLIQALFSVVENALSEASELDEENSRSIEVNFHRQANQGFLEIIDLGKGISEQDQGKIYEPFFTTREVGKGMGMGLSTAKATFDNMNSSVEYRRQEGKTIFTVSMICLAEETDNNIGQLEVKKEKMTG